jgi:NADH:ubiquinone oxidoreductase subunit 2 (subunit N)
LAAVVLVLGGLSLAGLPLTPGFPGRWMATALIARENMAAATLLLLGSAGGAVAVVRMTRTLFAPRAAHSVPPAERGDWLTTGVLAVVLIAAVVLALYPQSVISAAVRIADYYTYLQ